MKLFRLFFIFYLTIRQECLTFISETQRVSIIEIQLIGKIMKAFKIVITDGVSGEFRKPKWVKNSYEDANEAARHFIRLVEEVEMTEDYVCDVRKRQNWLQNYEPKQSETFTIELQMVVDDEPTPFNGDEFDFQTIQALSDFGFQAKEWIITEEFYDPD